VSHIQADRLCFTENQGQCGYMVLFKAETNGAVFYLCRDEVGYLFVRNTDELLEDDFSSEDDSFEFGGKSYHPHYKQEALLVKA
jgi:hypothetical protein